VVLYYFDSSALVKRYISERGTAWVLGITDPGARNIIFVARITAVEVVAAITRAARVGSITSADAFNAKANFRHDYLNQYWAMETDFSARRYWLALTLVSARSSMKAHIIQALGNPRWTNDVSS
jgi:predicted nucleic acid-binding protein